MAGVDRAQGEPLGSDEGSSPLMAATRPVGRGAQLSLLYDSKDFGKWERDWILYLLSDFDVMETLDPARLIDAAPCVLVTSHARGDAIGLNRADAVGAQLRRLGNRGVPAGLIHLSDEYLVAPVDFYPDAAFVFRNYLRPIDGDARYFALGAKSGLVDALAALPSALDRPFTWSLDAQVGRSKWTEHNRLRPIAAGLHVRALPAWQPVSGHLPRLRGVGGGCYPDRRGRAVCGRARQSEAGSTTA
jgi:hypothetical protein